MDLIVSTPQGEAEISVNAVHESVTVGDLLERVLSSKPPSLVYVDGRPTPTGTLLTAAGLVTGTLIEVAAPVERVRPAEITLVQAAGEGGGSRRPLGPGRYSLGTARRANVAPLSVNEVLVPRCELTVDHAGHVSVTANQGDLDGQLANTPAIWDKQRLRIGHRVFRLDPLIDDRAPALIATPQGQLNFVRPQRNQVVGDPEPAVRSRNGSRRLRRSRQHRAPEVALTPPPTPADPDRQAFDAELDTIRSTHVDLGEVVRRAMQLSDRLWERRPGDDDAFVFSLGLADQVWRADDPVPNDRRDLALLPAAPVLLDLSNQRGIGFACSPSQARAAARALVMQACVTHSPADLEIVVLSSRSGAARWEWIKWLPHARGPHGVQLLYDRDAITDWVNSQRTLATVVASIQSLGRPISTGRLTLAVVDDPAMWRGRAAMLRGLFAEAQLPIRFVALTDRADDVPAVCTTVVRIAANGAAEVDYPVSGPTVTDVVPFVLEHDAALAAARKLSPLEDHTAQLVARPVLPPVAPLASLIEPDGVDPDRIAQRWRDAGARCRVALGIGESEQIDVDLATEGPNVLIVGARRSGKTELLRMIVSSMAAARDPSSIHIVTVESTDGASFMAFADLPHLVGSVQRFDEHGGLRLLRALRSEVAHRAELLAEHGVTSFDEYSALGSAPAMARLVVVVDDADDVLARQPGFIPQLVELAESSRHLAVHVVLAVERLSRSLEQTLESFADVRVALRMSDPAEAMWLMGTRDPVQITPHIPGRGMIKRGDGETVPVQFASASAASGDLLAIAPFIIARDLNAAERKITMKLAAADSAIAPTGLRQLTDAITAAAEATTVRPAPLLFPELPRDLPYDVTPSIAPATTSATEIDVASDEGAPFALADLPAEHAQTVRRWNPANDGNLLVLGGASAERWNALATLLVAATDRYPVDRLHVSVIDCSSAQHGDSAVLEALAACAAVGSADDPDRILRLLVRLNDEIERRTGRDLGAADPHLVLFVNDVGSFLRTLELVGELEHGRDLLERIVGKGPLHGVTTVMSSASEYTVPVRLQGQFRQRIVLHLGDRAAYRALDVEPGRIPIDAPGRAITVPELVELQIATIADVPAAIEARSQRAGVLHGPARVPRTPEVVSADELCKATDFDGEAWRIPVGLDTRTLEPAFLRLHAPAGAFVLGDAGAGKSTVLMNIARCALSIDADVDVHAIASTWSPLLLMPHLTSATTLAGIDKWAAEFFDRTDRPRLVLIDDADRLEGPVFERLTRLEDAMLVVIIAGRTRVLDLPSHWSVPLRRSRAAIIPRPLAGDGGMFGLHLKVTSSHAGLGRGLLIDDDTVTPVLLAGPNAEREETGP